jgi:hypothetical protein
VLKSGKFMLVYVTQATNLLSADEAADFRRNLGCFSLDADIMGTRARPKRATAHPGPR